MLNNKRGIAMLIVVSLIFMLLTLTGAAFILSSGHFRTSHQQIERTRAFYAAEAGLQHALWRCRTGNLPAGCDLDNGCPALPSPWPITDTIMITNIPVNIEIWDVGDVDPRTGIAAPTGTRPVIATVTY